MKTYRGSCHCGAVRFEADIDVGAGTIRCNCSICSKLRLWSAVVQLPSFRLLAGEAEMTNYTFNTRTDQHPFCKHCGVHAFGAGKSPRWGQFFAVNIACLDDISIDELLAAPISYLDGRNDNWHTPPAETRHL
jgi:hypothetical protein